MQINLDTVEEYVEHEGTIRISGQTVPCQAALCAMRFSERGVSPIEFFYLGGNAGQQAMKAMGIFCFMVEQSQSAKFSVAFQPLMMKAKLGEKGQEGDTFKAVSIWRVMLVERPPVS